MKISWLSEIIVGKKINSEIELINQIFKNKREVDASEKIIKSDRTG